MEVKVGLTLVLLTRIHLILLLHKAEVFQPLLLRRGRIDERVSLLVGLTSSAADHSIDSTVQDVKTLLDKDVNVITLHIHYISRMTEKNLLIT